MTEFEIPLGNAPRCGENIHLVRWTRSADGWAAETLLATYVSSTHDEWVVDQSGQERRLSRPEWALFAL